MKIVVVSAGSDILAYLKAQESLKSCLFVQYNHPLKALDNLAEIDPDIIIWNADDYPRHWKICRAFCPNRPLNQTVALFLVTENGISDEEEKKAQFLDVDDLIEDGFFGENLVAILERRLPQVGAETESAKTVSPAWLVRDPNEWPQGPGHLLVIHPGLQELVIAQIIESDGRSLNVGFADPQDLAAFKTDLYIEGCMICVGDTSRQAILKTVPTEQPDRVKFLILQLAA
jgi:hypothetical protein